MPDVVKSLIAGFALLLVAYVIVAYVLMPAVWKRYVRRHPALEGVPGLTHTAEGIPGDPLNIALIGTEAEVGAAMRAATWSTADRLSPESDLRIAADTVLARPYPDAPVSNLYLWGRKEDLAFEQTVGSGPRRRHHVRLWKGDRTGPDGRPVWVGAATFDSGVGFSRTTGQITHHIAPDIDSERDRVVATLQAAGRLAEVIPVPDFQNPRDGANGGGDPWHTDGTLLMAVIAAPG